MLKDPSGREFMRANLARRLVLAGVLLLSLAGPIGCSNSSTASRGSSGPDASYVLTGGGRLPIGDVDFPWPLFDGTVPDVPPAVAPGGTWYCDPNNGDDTWDGTSFTFVAGTQGPKKTLKAALSSPSLMPGDTILLGGGIYREKPSPQTRGTATAPITIGSYGHGTGAPIIDGGLQPAAWTRYTAQGQKTVWQMSTATLSKITSATPVLGIYVNNGQQEAALREVIHGQVRPYVSDPLPPALTQTGIVDNSNNWYFDAAAQILYADFGGTLGDRDPNGADISILYNSQLGPAGHESLFVFWDCGYYNLVGLTVRASSWAGIFSNSSGLSIDRCDVKFNGGSGISLSASGQDITVHGNRVTLTRVWMNVLDNWPRFNNGYTGGGWPAAMSWYSESDALGEGNVIYKNGGEGLILYGTTSNGSTAHVSTNNVILHNVIFDNFSVNLYLDNTQGATLDGNFVFNHPRDASQTFDQLFDLSSGYDRDFGRRIVPPNLSLGDEPGSSFETPLGHAHLSDITVINNIFAGGKRGFLDYDDGTAVEYHGLKNCLIANNTFILGSTAVPGVGGFGWQHQFQSTTHEASRNSLLQNNIFVTADSSDNFVVFFNPTVPGVTLDYNLYSGPGQWSVGGASQDFSTWAQTQAPWDKNSFATDAMLEDVSAFSLPASEKLIYDWAKARPQTGSRALGGGVALSRVTADFTGTPRTSNDIGPLAGQ
jgi:hypothetical protein